MSEIILPSKMKINIVLRLAFLPPVFALILHWPADDWFWLDAWLLIASVEIVAISFAIWLFKTNPELAIERMKGNFQEGQSKKDSIIVLLLSSFMILIFPAAALDYRNQWLMFGVIYKLIGWFLFLISLWLLKKVMEANTYLSRSVVIQEEREQKVIDHGPYALMRHPMYTGVIVMALGFVMILGSGIALIPALISFIFLYLRAISEENLLEQELDGYNDYKAMVKKRLIPFLI